jgi:membrane protein implicated in regulation of membrane protease activity
MRRPEYKKGPGMKLGESMALVVGGIAMILACVLAGVEMARGGVAWLIVPLLVVLFWRERVIARLQSEVHRARDEVTPSDAPI